MLATRCAASFPGRAEGTASKSAVQVQVQVQEQVQEQGGSMAVSQNEQVFVVGENSPPGHGHLALHPGEVTSFIR
jgi:hypothetical protein